MTMHYDPNNPVTSEREPDPMTLPEDAGIKVYERPERRSFPSWAWLLLIVAIVVAAWLVFQTLG
jgi:type VI protein secretion system component VasF